LKRRDVTDLNEDEAATEATDTQGSERLQRDYEASRRAWAQAVGRPYDDAPDHRPPPGELDAEAEE
jgi:hypothetical protein